LNFESLAVKSFIPNTPKNRKENTFNIAGEKASAQSKNERHRGECFAQFCQPLSGLFLFATRLNLTNTKSERPK